MRTAVPRRYLLVICIIIYAKRSWARHVGLGIRRIYFSDRLYSEEELPPEFKLFLPVAQKAQAQAQQAQPAAQ